MRGPRNLDRASTNVGVAPRRLREPSGCGARGTRGRLSSSRSSSLNLRSCLSSQAGVCRLQRARSHRVRSGSERTRFATDGSRADSYRGVADGLRPSATRSGRVTSRATIGSPGGCSAVRIAAGRPMPVSTSLWAAQL